MSRVHTYKGREVTVTFETGRCIHAAECLRSLPGVFDTGRTPWVAPDEATAEAVEAAVARCPTGALKTQRDGERREQPDTVASVAVRPKGPLFLRGRLRVVDGEGRTMVEDYRLAFCRCGASAAKPFCDNRHKALPFLDPGLMAAAEVDPLETGGELQLDVLPDGPLHVTGPFLLRDASGEIRYAGAEAWLCRCGHSAEKPFCDGSHGRCGFKAP